MIDDAVRRIHSFGADFLLLRILGWCEFFVK